MSTQGTTASLRMNAQTTTAVAPIARLRFIDFLRAVAAQCIVWHHLAFYGPLSDTAHPILPRLLDLMSSHGRMAVQVFLVIGGFVTAQHLQRLRIAGAPTVLDEIGRRYLRTGGPYLVLLLIAVGANSVAAGWMEHRSISAAPTFAQLLAHAFYAQDILGYEALSAGVWYLAIDFQLFVLCLAVAALAQWWYAGPTSDDARGERPTQLALGTLALVSLFWFNRDSALDVWAVYFMGSYFLGMLLRWVMDARVPGRLLWLYLALLGAAVVIHWRPRLVVAAATALVILAMAALRRLERWPGSPTLAYLGRTSFSLFLVHFPVCLVVNAWFSRLPLTPVQAWGAMMVAWMASLATAVLFHHFVEQPFLRLARRRPLLA